MDQKIALFPLQLVVYPHQDLPLHIFEPRYRQLVNDCLQHGTSFGIPAYFDEKIHEYGTEVTVVDVVNQYNDGRMDIITKGKRIFKLSTFENPMKPKLYAGGNVQFQSITDNTNLSERVLFIEKVQELLELLNSTLEMDTETAFLSYKAAPSLGLSIQQEYQLLKLTTEGERFRFLIDHLTRNIPIIRNAERAKERIRRNGHFKHFDPLTF